MARDAIPGWDDETLRRVAQQNIGVGADAGLPNDVRFKAAVTRLIRKRLQHAVQGSDPALFFLLPSGPEGIDLRECRTETMLDNGVTQVEGVLWFVGPVVASGVGVDVKGWSDNEVFLRAARDLGAGDVPAVLFETRTKPPEARYFPRGIKCPDDYEIARLDASDISLSDILAVVSRMYEASLKTPDAHHKHGKLWANASKCWASEHAEDLIAFSLREGLTGAFPSCTVRAEQPQPSGRLDLEVEEPSQDDPSVITRHAVLELKVLRGFRSNGRAVSKAETDQWVEDGVRQAASYRDERGSRAAALCCFDMRIKVTGEECFKHVRGLARRHKIVVQVWHIFSSAKKYREATVE